VRPRPWSEWRVIPRRGIRRGKMTVSGMADKAGVICEASCRQTRLAIVGKPCLFPPPGFRFFARGRGYACSLTDSVPHVHTYIPLRDSTL